MFVKVTVSMQYLGSKDAPVAKPSSAIFVKFIANGNVVEVLFSLLCITPYPHCSDTYDKIRHITCSKIQHWIINIRVYKKI